MRRPLLSIVVWLAAAGCTALETTAPATEPDPAFLVEPTQQPYVRVTVGPVTGLVPEGWTAVPYDDAGPREGFIASPDPHRWRSVDGARPGFAASWVDATRVGVPRDLYYLAASGPLMSNLAASPGCHTIRHTIVTDHVPALAQGREDSPGDFIARAQGVCRRSGETRTRWSYFVAAPGFGPAMSLGIPGSGLYVAVAVTRDTPHADARLDHLLSHLRFGDTSVSTFVRVSRSHLT